MDVLLIVGDAKARREFVETFVKITGEVKSNTQHKHSFFGRNCVTTETPFLPSSIEDLLELNATMNKEKPHENTASDYPWIVDGFFQSPSQAAGSIFSSFSTFSLLRPEWPFFPVFSLHSKNGGQFSTLQTGLEQDTADL